MCVILFYNMSALPGIAAFMLQRSGSSMSELYSIVH